MITPLPPANAGIAAARTTRSSAPAGTPDAASIGGSVAAAAVAGGSQPASGRLDSAALSAAVAAMAAAPPPVDEARVAALRDAIAGGQYHVEPAHIANAMLRLDGVQTAPAAAPEA